EYKGTTRPAGREFGRDPAAERIAVEDDALGRHPLTRDPVERREGGVVAALLAGRPTATAVAGIIEGQHRDIQHVLQPPILVSEEAEITAIAVRVQQGASRILRGTPPGVD